MLVVLESNVANNEEQGRLRKLEFQVYLTHKYIITYDREKAEKFTAESKLECSNCKKTVHAGTAGYTNLDMHRASKACVQHGKANVWNRPTKPNHSLNAFFKPRAPLNPPTVSVPPPIHPAEKFAGPADLSIDLYVSQVVAAVAMCRFCTIVYIWYLVYFDVGKKICARN